MAEAEIRRESPFSEPTPNRRKPIVEIVTVIVISILAYYIKLELPESQQNLAYSVLLFVFLILILKNIVYGIAAIVIAIGLSPDGVGGMNNFRLEDFMLPPLLIIWWIKRMSNRETLIATDIMGAVKVYMFIAALGTLKGIVDNTVWTPLISATFYIKYIQYFIICWFVYNAIKTKEDIILILFTTFMTCAVVAWISWEGRIAAQGGDIERFVRASGPAGETPNVLGGYYMMHLMMAFSLFFAVRNYIYKAVILAFLMAVALPLLYTYSRTSFSSVFIGLFVISVFVDLRYIFLMVIILGFSPLLMPEKNFLSEDVIDRYDDILTIFDDSEEGGAPSSWKARTVGWYIFYTRTMHSSPIIGRGVGSIGLGIDSSYVKKFIESGILGILAFLWLIARIGRLSLEVIKNAKDSFYKAVGVGYMGVFAGMLVHAIGVSSFSTIRTAELFWMFTGILISVSVFVKKQRELEEEEKLDRDRLSFKSSFAVS